MATATKTAKSQADAKKAPAKKAPAKKAPAKKKASTKKEASAKKTDSVKSSATKEVAEKRTGKTPTPKEVKVLELVASSPKTRKQLIAATGIQKGWSDLLGAPTREILPNTMQGKGWIKQEKVDNVLTIKIMAAGKKVLEKALANDK